MSKKVVVVVSLALLAALAAGFWFAAPALAEENALPGKWGQWLRLRQLRQHSVVGQITALGENEFTILTVKEETLVFKVDENTRYRQRDQQPASEATLGFEDLQVGQWVAVAAPNARARAEEAERTARLVIVLPEDFNPDDFAGAMGEVKSVDTAAGKFSLATRSGETITVQIAEDTRFLGEFTGLSDVQVGMKVAVRGAKQEDGSLTARLVIGRLPIKRVGGTVIKVQAQSFTIETRLGEQLTFQVTEKTHFRSRGGEVNELADLKETMRVMVIANQLPDESYQALQVIVGQQP